MRHLWNFLYRVYQIFTILNVSSLDLYSSVIILALEYLGVLLKQRASGNTSVKEFELWYANRFLMDQRDVLKYAYFVIL